MTANDPNTVEGEVVRHRASRPLDPHPIFDGVLADWRRADRGVPSWAPEPPKPVRDTNGRFVAKPKGGAA